MTPSRLRLKKICDTLISDESSWIIRKQALEQLHELFVEFGALDVQDGNYSHRDKRLATGKAIAPTWAAMCIFDIARTRQFVLGLRAAISDCLLLKQRRLRVLDAGCGPYGLLSILAAIYFTEEDVHFTLLDIFEENISSARLLVKAFSLEDRFEFICADALSYQWPDDEPLDIVVTETMNAALSKEPQVAITLQLAPQLLPDGIFIPERIELSLVWAHGKAPATTMAEQSEGIVYEPLGTILELTKFSSREQVMHPRLKTVELPTGFQAAQKLELHSSIRVYKQHCINHNQSAISLPKVIKFEQGGPVAGDSLVFQYRITSEPGISVEVEKKKI